MEKQTKKFFRKKIIYAVIAPLFLPVSMMEEANARDEFDSALLELGSSELSNLDLSMFEVENGQLPGNYRVDIYLNNELMETRNIDFLKAKNNLGKDILQPCLSLEELSGYGIIINKFPELKTSKVQCANISAIPQARADYLFNKQQLLLSFPQTAVNNAARGWVDPALWDNGITALMLNYNFSGSVNKADNNLSNDSDNQYLSIQPGLNVGAWRLRNYSTWNRSSNKGEYASTQSKWDTVYTYLQRDITLLKSQLTFGDSSTPSDIFDSVPFRGVQLASDEEMLPESLRGYAPVVRGIARTNAQVIIRQNGYTIYETYVSPGAFEITDMYPTGSSGDLNVTIKESDGSEQNLVVPYASLPVLQREGQFKFALTSATYRPNNSSVTDTPFTQGTIIYGFPASITGYTGGQFSSKYQSLALGMGKNMGMFGAVSFDMTHAWSKMKDSQRDDGRSLRARFSKNFVDSGTNFAIAGYRYATKGYRDMAEVMDSYSDGFDRSWNLERRKNRGEITINQSLWDSFGNLAINAVREDYWGTNHRMESYGVSYNNSYNGITYGLNYTFNKNTIDDNSAENRSKKYDTDHIFSLSLNIPLSSLFGEHPTYATYMVNTSKNGNTTNQITLSGSALESNNLNWSAMEGYGSQGQGNTAGITADWRTGTGEVNGGYNFDRYGKRINYGLRGGIVAHEEGITFGQSMGETSVIVSAPGAGNVGVQGQSGVTTDFRGYTIVPYASPYRKNNITLDTETFDEGVDIAITTATVVPTRGAIVKASYKASVGYRVLLSLTRRNGKPVPFGATVSVADTKDTDQSIVGDNGQVYLTGLPEKSKLLVQWSKEASDKCQVNLNIPADNKGVLVLDSLCH
ncbi:TPA: fimbria/pilus outer membrane usher protein [Klebsiella michiganensis]